MHESLQRSNLKWFLLLAVLFTALNSVKPLCIDDTLYYFNARQVASEPLSPYAYNVFWNDRPEPAVQVLAPALFSYYWSLAIRLFGDDPIAWKLWMLPFSLLLVFALRSLFERFAAGYALPLTYFVVLSPVFLPSFNLMLEVPVAALSLSALALFFAAADRDSFSRAALAGLVAGMAMQTKYSAFVVPVVILLYALLDRKLMLGMIAAVMAALFFGSFELFIFAATGHSHLFFQSQVYGSVNALKKYMYLSWPLVTLTGGIAPTLAILGLTALGAGKRIVYGACVAVALGYIVIAFLPGSAGRGQKMETLIFSLFGLSVFTVLAVVIWRHLKLTHQDAWKWTAYINDWRVELFLALWLVVEIGAYFALSPIPAVRRMTILLVVGTLIVGRLAARSGPESDRRTVLRTVVAANILLGLLFYAVDLNGAFVEKSAAERAAAAMQRVDPSSRRWYTGRWGFQFYGERAGMNPVSPDESQLKPGDLLAISDGAYWTKPLENYLRTFELERVDQITVDGEIPLQTMLGYYNSGIAIHHHQGPQRRVRIFRIIGRGQTLLNNDFSIE